MKILKDKEIFGIEGSKYLSEESIGYVKKLAALSGDASARAAYSTIEGLVSTIPGWSHGSIMECFIEALNPAHTPQSIIKATLEGESTRVDWNKYLSGIAAKTGEFGKGHTFGGVYFAEEGFLGFAFQPVDPSSERKVLMVQLPYEGFNHFMVGYRHPESKYSLAKKCLDQDSRPGPRLDLNYGCTGPMGTEFIERMERND